MSGRGKCNDTWNGCSMKSGEKVIEGTIAEIVKASGKTDLEEAYLYFMGEEDLL